MPDQSDHTRLCVWLRVAPRAHTVTRRTPTPSTMLQHSTIPNPLASQLLHANTTTPAAKPQNDFDFDDDFDFVPAAAPAAAHTAASEPAAEPPNGPKGAGMVAGKSRTRWPWVRGTCMPIYDRAVDNGSTEHNSCYRGTRGTNCY